MSAQMLATVCATAVLALCACGDDDEPSTSASTPTATAESVAGSELNPDQLVAVHDALYECLRKGDVGTLVGYRDGQAVVGESFGQPRFESGLAAPEETAKAIGGGAQYVGLRDDKRVKGRTPDWDVLMFSSEDAAVEATTALRKEVGDPAGAVQSGRFVTIVLPHAKANGDAPEDAEAKLEACQMEAEVA
jgi:hypothetical protein